MAGRMDGWMCRSDLGVKQNQTKGRGTRGKKVLKSHIVLFMMAINLLQDLWPGPNLYLAMHQNSECLLL